MIAARLSPKAERDLDDICRYIAADNIDAAERLRHTILDTVDFLVAHPEVGRQILDASARHAQTRWFVVPRFRNYLIFYPSPIYHITTNLPPVLIYHGGADTLTPLEQSEWFQGKAHEAGRTVQIVVHPGGQHGWLTMVFDIRKFADWFDQHLRPGR